MTDALPVDAWGIKQYGTQRWVNDCHWPVAQLEHDDFYGLLEDGYMRVMDSASPEMKSCLLIQNKFCSWTGAILHAYLVYHRFREMGRSIVIGERSSWYPSFVNDEFPEASFGGAYASVSWGRHRLRQGRGLWRNNSSANLRGLVGGGSLKVLGNVSSIVQEYARTQGLLISEEQNDVWFDGWDQVKLEPRFITELEQVAQELAKVAGQVGERCGAKLTDAFVRYMQRQTFCNLENTAKGSRAVRRHLNGRAKNIRVATSLVGDLTTRTIAQVVAEQGGDVTFSVHGGDVGIHQPRHWRWLMFEIPTRFVTYTPRCADAYASVQKIHAPKYGSAAQIVHAQDERYAVLRSKYAGQHSGKKIKSVMVMGFPLNPWYYEDRPAGNGLLNLDVALRCINILKAEGYEVLYKAHPDRLKEVRGIMDGIAEVVAGEFSDDMGRADAFLFTYMYTSSFAYALCTDKPVIACVVDGYEYGQGPYARIQERCGIVSMSYDENNRCSFTNESLLDALEGSVELRENSQLVEEYFIGSATHTG